MSKDNPQIKRVRALLQSSRQRREERAFVVEGVRLVEEALAAEQVSTLFVCPDLLASHARSRAFLDNLQDNSGRLTIHVEPSVFAPLADTATPQGVVAVCTMPEETTLEPPVALAVLLDGVQDPGNAGMILRAAAAANADAVLFGPGSVDPYNPKVLRGAMGGHFRTALHDVRSEAAVRACAGLFAQRVVASARDGARYDILIGPNRLCLSWARRPMEPANWAAACKPPPHRFRWLEALNPSTWRWLRASCFSRRCGKSRANHSLMANAG